LTIKKSENPLFIRFLICSRLNIQFTSVENPAGVSVGEAAEDYGAGYSGV